MWNIWKILQTHSCKSDRGKHSRFAVSDCTVVLSISTTEKHSFVVSHPDGRAVNMALEDGEAERRPRTSNRWQTDTECLVARLYSWQSGREVRQKNWREKKQAASWRRFVFGKEEMCRYKDLEVTLQKQKCKLNSLFWCDSIFVRFKAIRKVLIEAF